MKLWVMGKFSANELLLKDRNINSGRVPSKLELQVDCWTMGKGHSRS
jgi:hypothetical protein